MQGVPADMAGIGDSAAPANGEVFLPRESGPQYNIQTPAQSEASAPAMAESVVAESVVAESAADGLVAEDVAEEEAVALEKAASNEVAAESASQIVVQSGSSFWPLIRAILGGLVVLLGLLWLRSRKIYL